MNAEKTTLPAETAGPQPEYHRPEVEAVLTPAELEREVLFAGAPPSQPPL